jgi:hypothetical protein
MNTAHILKRGIVGLTTSVFLSGGLVSGGLTLAGPAQAGPPLPPHTWCPGNSMVYSRYDMSSGPGLKYQWDMNICHTWYWVNGTGNVPYDGSLPSDVWDGPDGPPAKEDSCAFCW